MKAAPRCTVHVRPEWVDRRSAGRDKTFSPAGEHILQGLAPTPLLGQSLGSEASGLGAPRGFFSFIEDRFSRMIMVFFAVYTGVLLVVPFARLVPRLPIPLLSFLLCYLLYRWKVLPRMLRPWLFYLVLVLSYWELQFVVNTYFTVCHGAGVIEMERSLFGGLPTVWLQRQLHPGPELAWFDYVFAAFHASLFVIPLAFPLALLLRRGPERMQRSTVALTFISLAGYATYVLFPLTPPWMASLERMIPEVHRITVTALGEMVPGGIISAFSPSPRGAMPSLHAGVPLLMLMMALREFGWRASWLAIIVLGIWFEIIYGAEHYVMDVAAGTGYAVISYIVVYRWIFPDRKLGGGPTSPVAGGGEVR